MYRCSQHLNVQEECTAFGRARIKVDQLDPGRLGTTPAITHAASNWMDGRPLRIGSEQDVFRFHVTVNHLESFEEVERLQQLYRNVCSYFRRQRAAVHWIRHVFSQLNAKRLKHKEEVLPECMVPHHSHLKRRTINFELRQWTIHHWHCACRICLLHLLQRLQLDFCLVVSMLCVASHLLSDTGELSESTD